MSNTKYWPTKKIKEVLNENYNRGTTGIDYDDILPELKSTLYSRENKRADEINKRLEAMQEINMPIKKGTEVSEISYLDSLYKEASNKGYELSDFVQMVDVNKDIDSTIEPLKVFSEGSYLNITFENKTHLDIVAVKLVSNNKEVNLEIRNMNQLADQLSDEL